MPSREGEGKKREKEPKPYVPCFILAYALRNAICRVSPGATVVASKSELISETVQNAQRKRIPTELEKRRKGVLMEGKDIET